MRCRNLGIPTTLALYFAVLCAVWMVFKQVEPTIFPVVSDFKVTRQNEIDGSLIISGTFIKNRHCVPTALLGYDKKKFITVDFPIQKNRLINRLTGEQTYRGWMLTPISEHITLYVTHDCFTGLVVTELGTVHTL